MRCCFFRELSACRLSIIAFCSGLNPWNRGNPRAGCMQPEACGTCYTLGTVFAVVKAYKLILHLGTHERSRMYWRFKHSTAWLVGKRIKVVLIASHDWSDLGTETHPKQQSQQGDHNVSLNTSLLGESKVEFLDLDHSWALFDSKNGNNSQHQPSLGWKNKTCDAGGLLCVCALCCFFFVTLFWVCPMAESAVSVKHQAFLGSLEVSDLTEVQLATCPIEGSNAGQSNKLLPQKNKCSNQSDPKMS